MTQHRGPAADIDRGIRKCLDTIDQNLAALRVLYEERGDGPRSNGSFFLGDIEESLQVLRLWEDNRTERKST